MEREQQAGAAEAQDQLITKAKRLGRVNPAEPSSGVTDGTRTRDPRDHNPVLYQLSYSHHVDPRRHSAGRGADQ